MQFKDYKFHFILLAVALVLCIVVSVLSLSGRSSMIGNAVGTVMTPVRWLVTKAGDGLSGITGYFGSNKALNSENEQLKEENERLQLELEKARILQEENERLRNYLGLQDSLGEYRFCEAQIIGYEAGNYKAVIVLNKGTSDGIRKNMAVITETGLVGRVSDVGLKWAKISTVLSTDASVGIYDARSGAVGVIEGDLNLKYGGQCVVRYLRADDDITIGDLILTSGAGSVFPADLAVGHVTEIGWDNLTKTRYAVIEPVVDLSVPGSVNKVMVLIPQTGGDGT
ncbi:MAG: rod shape-determining protein MreC [Clostridia bacterium]|nr:rod shape-determining protein MreC [Clostridia bacterium]